MDDQTPPPIQVGEPAEGRVPYRRVTIKGTPVGKATELADVVEFARRAGLEDLDPRDPALVTWHGGGPDEWTP